MSTASIEFACGCFNAVVAVLCVIVLNLGIGVPPVLDLWLAGLVGANATFALVSFVKAAQS